jgi:streptomycin 6-kinase
LADAGLTPTDWRATAPELVAECAEVWGLRVGEPYTPGVVGHVVRVELPDGTPAVLKVFWPHPEAEQEADALERWGGDGAVRLLARDDARNALLLERCEPGTHLSVAGAEPALDVLIGLLPRLWQPAGPPFRPLAEEAAWWLSYLPRHWEESGRPFERKLLDAAVAALSELRETQGEQVLLHQDLHAENVLAAQREPWLAIDPKPLAGEREFAVAPIARGSELGHNKRAVLHRFDRLTSELGLDRERARGWALGQTLAWAYDGRWHADHIDVARWLVEPL